MHSYTQCVEATFHGMAEVVATGNDGRHYVVLDHTLFYPQGGGQKADKGLIGENRVEHVAADEVGLVRHYIAAPEQIRVGEIVEMEVDREWRRLNSRLHTAGHLVASLVEDGHPRMTAHAGHHWPGEARVDFTGDIAGELSDLEAELVSALGAAIGRDEAVAEAVDDHGVRFVRIGRFKAYSCGGTHVASLGTLGVVTVRSIRKKGSTIRIGYDVAAP